MSLIKDRALGALAALNSSLFAISESDRNYMLQNSYSFEDMILTVDPTLSTSLINSVPFSVTIDTPVTVKVQNNYDTRYLDQGNPNNNRYYFSQTVQTSNSSVNALSSDQGVKATYETPKLIQNVVGGSVVSFRRFMQCDDDVGDTDGVQLGSLFPIPDVNGITSLLVTQNDNTDYKLKAYKPVFFNDALHNTTAVCILLIFKKYKNETIALNTPGGGVLVSCRNAWIDGETFNFNLTITASCVVIQGTNLSTVVGNQLVYIDALINLSDALTDIIIQIDKMNEVLATIQDYISDGKAKEFSDFERLLSSTNPDKSFLNSFVTTYSILSDMIGNPGIIGDVSKYMKAAYKVFEDGLIKSSNVPISSEFKSVASLGQAWNDMLFKVYYDDQYSVDELSLDFEKMATIVGDDNALYCTVSMIAQDAFGTTSLEAALGTYGDVMKRVNTAIGRYPVHTALKIEERMVGNLNVIRNIWFDVGIDFLQVRQIGNGGMITDNNISYVIYNGDNMPIEVQKRIDSPKTLILKSSATVIGFDLIIELIEHMKKVFPPYNMLECNCQDASNALYNMLVNGELKDLTS